MRCPIQNWFATHQDGDFVLSPRSDPFSVVPPIPTTETVIYCTKPYWISRLVHDLGDQPTFAAILRGGLPSDADVDWLASIVGSRRLLFLGDADPPDLLIYAWLRERIEIGFLGISDQLLTRCAVSRSDNLLIRLSETESAAMPLVSQMLADSQDQLGQWCWDLLASHCKIELEALLNFAACTPSEMEAALVA